MIHKSSISNENLEDHSYVRIKINHSRDNKVKGFYLLMTNGNTYSDKKDEFIVEKRFLKLLEGNNITFQLLPLNPSEEDDSLQN
ncbi:hypothetical protein HYW74_02010 [Candidatus Pacearchaeota archaeon]|nr:hypothetical protein [Candidatus Pacearchaeota archaeon]